MGTFLDYLAWRGDLSFEASPFNEVDNLILAELAYTKMEDGRFAGHTKISATGLKETPTMPILSCVPRPRASAMRD